MDHRVNAYFNKNFKWSIASLCEMDDDMPLVKGSRTIPHCLVSALDLKKNLWYGAFAHWFHSDYTFDGEHGIWLDTTKYLPLLDRFKGLLSPDYSLYTDMGRIPQMWNVYRNRLTQIHLEELGFDVISTVSWADEPSFDFCFKGLPKHRVVAVSTVGVMNAPKKTALFETGYKEMCKRLEPEFVVLYGSDKGLNLGETPYRCFRNKTYDWTHLHQHN